MRANRVVFFVLTVAALYAAGARPGEAAQPAQGQVVATFTVPVKLTGLLPEVTGGWVSCTVHGQGGMGQRVGIGVVNFSVDSSTGSFSQNLVVPVTADPGADLSLATNYHCELDLIAVNGRGAVSTATNAPAWARAKPGTPFTSVYDGALPQ